MRTQLRGPLNALLSIADVILQQNAAASLERLRAGDKPSPTSSRGIATGAGGADRSAQAFHKFRRVDPA
jgi:hypothetical protein